MLTLGDVVKKYSISNAVLKMDCEGSEYDIILNTDNADLGAFDEIFLEYHYGYLDLVKKLEGAGFKVEKIGYAGSFIPNKTGCQIYYYDKAADYHDMALGFMYAHRPSARRVE